MEKVGEAYLKRLQKEHGFSFIRMKGTERVQIAKKPDNPRYGSSILESSRVLWRRESS